MGTDTDIKILIGGDFSPRTKVSNMFKSNKFEEVLHDMKEVASAHDYSIVNFETTVADETDIPIEKHGPNLKTGEYSVAALAWAGIDMATLANNHIFDYGQSAFEKTLSALEAHGIGTVGGGKDINEAKSTAIVRIKGKRIAIINCAEHEFCIATENHGGANSLDPITQFYKIKEARENADYVIVIVHGGHEQFPLPSKRMKGTYRYFIDCGADAVINHHQHCFSGYEIYKGKPIAYGLGNLVFDIDNEGESWYEGCFASLGFGERGISLRLIPYIQCKEEPSISLLSDISDFDNRVQQLNDIIQSDEKLIQKTDEFYEKHRKYMFSQLQPYSNRYLMALYYRNILPSMISNKKRLGLLNFVTCESHLDVFRHILKQS